MKISFIGAGKVGTAIGYYLSEENDVLYYYSRRMESAKKASEYVGCNYTDSLNILVHSSDIIFITTNDDKIKEVAESLISYDVKGKVFVHMSGALSSEELLSLKHAGAYTASMHPLLAFSDIKKASKDLKQIYFSLEGDIDKIKMLLEGRNKYFILSKEDKVLYHLSACIFSNYLVTLLHFGENILSKIGIDEGLDAMKPLIEASLSNVYLKGTKDALTGPIKRGDIITLTKHLSELDGMNKELYILLGKYTSMMIKDEKLNSLWRENG